MISRSRKMPMTLGLRTYGATGIRERWRKHGELRRTEHQGAALLLLSGVDCLVLRWRGRFVFCLFLTFDECPRCWRRALLYAPWFNSYVLCGFSGDFSLRHALLKRRCSHAVHIPAASAARSCWNLLPTAAWLPAHVPALLSSSQRQFLNWFV